MVGLLSWRWANQWFLEPLSVPCLRIPLSLDFWGREGTTRQGRLEALVQ